MALIKTDNTIISIKGKFAGTYFKSGKDGIHCQAWPKQRSFTRSAQVTYGIMAFSSCASAWVLLLIVAWAAAWSLFGAENYYEMPNGLRKRISGWMWFVHINMRFPECQQLPMWKPPFSLSDFPDIYVVFRGYWSYNNPVEEWPEYSPMGYFWKSGSINGRYYYEDEKRIWYLWWNGRQWIISRTLGFYEPCFTWYGETKYMYGRFREPCSGHSSKAFYGNNETYEDYGGKPPI